jgi:hypothetical protein
VDPLAPSCGSGVTRGVADQARGAGVAFWLVSEITISGPCPKTAAASPF